MPSLSHTTTIRSAAWGMERVGRHSFIQLWRKQTEHFVKTLVKKEELEWGYANAAEETNYLLLY